MTATLKSPNVVFSCLVLQSKMFIVIVLKCKIIQSKRHILNERQSTGKRVI